MGSVDSGRPVGPESPAVALASSLPSFLPHSYYYFFFYSYLRSFAVRPGEASA
jgi:hypothetical protein